MVAIKKMGRLLDTDAEGYVINPCGWEHIQDPWLPLVTALQQETVELLQDRLHSLYVRGSIPRGQGIPGVSDLDVIAVLQDEAAIGAELETLRRSLNRRFRLCTGVEILGIPLAGIQDPANSLRAVLKTQTLWIAGIDLRPQLPPVKPGPDLISHAFTLERDISTVMMELRGMSAHDGGSEAFVRRRCGWIARRLVRSGFELVMEQEGSFTRDLYPCYEVFAKYFPEQQRSMRKALELAIQPSSNRAGLVVFLDLLGGWLVTEIERTFWDPSLKINT